MVDKKADEGQPAAVAMKIILDNGGRIAQKQLKKELAQKLSNSSRITQTSSLTCSRGSMLARAHVRVHVALAHVHFALLLALRAHVCLHTSLC